MKKNNLKTYFRSFGLEQAELQPLQVVVENGNFENAYRLFKSLTQKERIVGDFKTKQFYEKPSEKKKRKTREAKERKMMLEVRERMILSGEWDKLQKRKAAKRQQKINKKKPDSNDE